MNKLIVILLGFLFYTTANAEDACNMESIKTNEIESCIRITNSKIESEIHKLVLKKIRLLNNAKSCQERFDEIYPGKEAHIEKLLCIQEKLEEFKDSLQLESENVNNKKGIVIYDKSMLYEIPNKLTTLYLLKGDQVIILDEKTDKANQKWYFINYKGKKDINMWIKAEAVDVIE